MRRHGVADVAVLATAVIMSRCPPTTCIDCGWTGAPSATTLVAVMPVPGHGVRRAARLSQLPLGRFIARCRGTCHRISNTAGANTRRRAVMMEDGGRHGWSVA